MRADAERGRDDAARVARVIANARRIRAETRGRPDDEIHAELVRSATAILTEPVSPDEMPKPLPLERIQLALLAVGALAAVVAYGKRFPSPVDPVVTLS